MENHTEFSFELATSIRFGWGAASGVGLELSRRFGERRVLLVTDEGIRKAGLADPVRESLLSSGLQVAEYDGVRPNPTDSDCLQGAEAARAFGAQILVALGGGSVMDAAKAAAVLSTGGGEPGDYEGYGRLAAPPLPVVCLPTTAGTGSEVTLSAVITDTKRHVKMTLKDPRMAPALAILDPALTLGLPRSVTAATGVDALVHALEAFTCRKANPITDALALRAMEWISLYLPDAVENGENRTAREGMMLASHLAGLAFGRSDVAAVHCMAEALGGVHDVPHGEANAMFLPEVARFNFSAAPGRHRRAMEALGLKAADMADEEAEEQMYRFLAHFVDRLGIPKLRDLPGLDPQSFRAMAENAAQNGSAPSNARAVGPDDFERLFERTYHR